MPTVLYCRHVPCSKSALKICNINVIHKAFENVGNRIFRNKRAAYQIMKMLRTKGLDKYCVSIQLVFVLHLKI